MKNIIFTFIICGILNSLTTYGQDSENDKKIPNIQLKDLNGNIVNTSELTSEGPVIISFWATWCAPCKRELNTIHEIYPDWQEESGVTLVAVSIDDEKTKSSVPTYVNSRKWTYTVLMDTERTFKNAMGVVNVPHTFLINTNGTIVYSHNTYSPGDENLLYEELMKLVKKQ